MKHWWVLVAVVLLVAPASAFHQEEGVEHYELERATRSDINPAPGEIFNITFDNTPEHNLDIVSTDYKVAVTQTAFLQAGSDGVWNVTLQVNGQNVTNCYWYIETVDPGGFLTGDLIITPHMTPFCDLGMSLPPGINTLTLFRSVESGSPDPILSNVIAVIVSREDITVMSQDTNFEALMGLTAAEFSILPLLAVLGLFLWTRQDIGVRLFGTFLILLDAAVVVAFYARAEAWAGILVLFPLFVLAWVYTTLRMAFELRQDALGRRRTREAMR